jgi:hypothetical protein
MQEKGKLQHYPPTNLIIANLFIQIISSLLTNLHFNHSPNCNSKIQNRWIPLIFQEIQTIECKIICLLKMIIIIQDLHREWLEPQIVAPKIIEKLSNLIWIIFLKTVVLLQGLVILALFLLWILMLVKIVNFMKIRLLTVKV